MTDATSRRVRSRGVLTLGGAGLILIAGLIHLVLTPEHLEEAEEATYLGLLFLANFVGAATAAFGIFLGHRWGWVLGALVAGGAYANLAIKYATYRRSNDGRKSRLYQTLASSQTA